MGMRFSKLVIADSLRAGEFASAQHLFKALERLPDLLNRPVQIEYVNVPNRDELESFFHRLLRDDISNGHTLLLHFECHGNDDGVSLASQEFLYWNELCQYLTPLNVATRLNLFVSIAACFGGFLLTQQTPATRAPFFACLSTTRNAYPDELLGGFSRFYHTLLSTLDGDEANAHLRATTPEGLFYFAQALDSFKLTYSNYLSRLCTPEAYLRRAGDIQEEQRENGQPVAALDEICHMLRATEQQKFEELRTEHFMIDIFPENDERFPVTFAQVDHR